MAEVTEQLLRVVDTLNWGDDTKQDFFVRWLERKDDLEFDNDGHLATFVNQDMRYYNLNEIKVAANRERLEMLHTSLLADELHDRMQTDNSDPLSNLIEEETIAINLDSLSAALRETAIQYYVEGRAPEDIATLNDENVAAVRKRITRARQQLKEIN